MPKLKWDINTEEPEDEEGYEPYDGPLPPSGVYYIRVPRMQIVTSRNGDDMYKAMWFIDDPREGKRKYEGYGPGFDNVVILEQVRWKAKQMAVSLQATWRDLVDKTITESDERPTNVKSIGKVKWGGKRDPMARVQLRKSNDPEYGERLEISNWLPWKDPEDLDRDDADPDDGTEDEDDTGTTGDGDDAPGDDGSEESEGRRAELEAMSDDDLIAIAEELELDLPDEDADDDDWNALIDDILEAEDEIGEPEDDEGESDDPRRDELEEMSRGQLVKLARSLGIKPVRSSTTDEQLVDAILEREEQEGNEPEPEPDPEPEPEPERPRRGRGRKAAESKGRQTGRRGSKGKAPF